MFAMQIGVEFNTGVTQTDQQINRLGAVGFVDFEKQQASGF